MLTRVKHANPFIPSESLNATLPANPYVLIQQTWSCTVSRALATRGAMGDDPFPHTNDYAPEFIFFAEGIGRMG